MDVIETAAILDAKWMVINKKCLLVAASALSEIIVYELKDDDHLHFVDKISLASDGDENPINIGH